MVLHTTSHPVGNKKYTQKCMGSVEDVTLQTVTAVSLSWRYAT